MYVVLLFGQLAGWLSIISITLFLILVIPAFVWVFRTRRAISSYSDADEWLDVDPKMKKAGESRKSLWRMAIWGFHNHSRRKKLIIISVTVIFIVLSSWLIWEIFPYQNRTNIIYNDDTRVFWEASADQSSQTLSIKGANTPLLDTRSCRVHFILPFDPTSDGKVNITSSWILIYHIEGYTTLTVEQWIYGRYEHSITNEIVFSKSIEYGNDEDSISNTTLANMGYTCYHNHNYYIGVVLSVWLTGFSSVEATLAVTSLNATI